MKLRTIASLLLTSTLLLGTAQMVNAQEGATAASLYNDALEKLKSDDYRGALPLLEQAVEKADPEKDAEVIKLAKRNGAVAAYKAGNDYRKENKNEEALKAYDAGIGFAPTFYANFIGRAQALEGLNQNAEAVKAYLKAAEVSVLNKKEDKAEELNAKAENMVAVTFGDKKWEETINLAQAFLESKETADVHYYLALALKEKGNAGQAVEHGMKAVELASGDKSKYLMGVAESYEALNQSDKAIEVYKQITDSKYAERAQYKIKELSGGK